LLHRATPQTMYTWLAVHFKIMFTVFAQLTIFLATNLPEQRLTNTIFLELVCLCILWHCVSQDFNAMLKCNYKLCANILMIYNYCAMIVPVPCSYQKQLSEHCSNSSLILFI
jgi:hypothetical protein